MLKVLSFKQDKPEYVAQAEQTATVQSCKLNMYQGYCPVQQSEPALTSTQLK